MNSPVNSETGKEYSDYSVVDLARWKTDLPSGLHLRDRNTSMHMPVSSGDDIRIEIIIGVRRQEGEPPEWKPGGLAFFVGRASGSCRAAADSESDFGNK